MRPQTQNSMTEHLNSLFVRLIFKFNLKIHHNTKIFLHPTQLIFIQQTVAQLHHKWCVHSVLPVATRVKQPTHVNTQNINCNTEESVFCALTGTQTHTHAHTVHLAVELTRFQLTAGGGERSGPNMSMWFCYVHVRWVGGGT